MYTVKEQFEFTHTNPQVMPFARTYAREPSQRLRQLGHDDTLFVALHSLRSQLTFYWFMPLEEAIASWTVIVILSGPDGRQTEALLEPVK